MSNIVKTQAIALDLQDRRLENMFETIKEDSLYLMDLLLLSETPVSEVNLHRNVSKLECIYAMENSSKLFVCSVQDKSFTNLSSAKSCDNKAYTYSHPYELDHFTVPKHQLQFADPIKYRTFETTPLVMVEDRPSFQKMIQEVSRLSEISVDVKGFKYKKSGGFISLLQISTRNEDYIIDIPKLQKIPDLDLSELNAVFADHKILKVFHEAAHDICSLQYFMGVYVINMFDISEAAVVLDYPASLKFLLRYYFSINLHGRLERHDWIIRPLTQPIIDSVRCSTHYLLYIHDVIRNKLLEDSKNENLLHLVYKKSTSICQTSVAKASMSEHCRNMSKPQLKFVDPVDNSTKPFRPYLQHKPHGLEPLRLQLSTYIDGTKYYTHPYEYELEKFVVPQHQLKSVDPIEFSELESTPLVMVENGPSFQEMIQHLSKHREISVDVEMHRERAYQPLICLLQISTRNMDYIVDILKLKQIPGLNLWHLNEVFANPNILKVFHGAQLDIEWLQLAMSVYVVNMFDTYEASILLDYPQRSLAALLNQHCSVVLDKKYQRADWRVRPLPEALLNYARSDTHYLLYLYDVMRNELLKNTEKNLLHAVYETSTDVCKRRYEKPAVSSTSHFKLLKKHFKSVNERQLYALRKLFVWRDHLARRRDESSRYILSDQVLLRIALKLPRTLEEISNHISINNEKELLKVLAVIEAAIQQPLEKEARTVNDEAR